MPILSDSTCNPVCRVCHYKDLDYSTQLERKQAWANLQLGQWKDVLQTIVPAPEDEQLAYRSKSWMMSSFKNGALSFGMFRAVRVDGRWEKEFISWNTCPIHVRPIQQMTAKLGPALVQAAPQFVENSLVGVWLGSPQLVIVSRESGLEEMRCVDWQKILVPPFDRVWFHRNRQVGKKIFGYEPIHPLAGPPSADNSEHHPIRAFRQVAQSLLVQARARAIQSLLEAKPTQVLDLYCGTGELSRLLPSEVGWIGIEQSSDAVKYANSLQPTRRSIHSAFVGAVEDRLSDPRVLDLIRGPYALYINPPRSGLTLEAKEQVRRLIQKEAPTAIVYLSCSASSLARDLKMFESEGYSADLLQPYDFFPQTEHFETLAVLSLKR